MSHTATCLFALLLCSSTFGQVTKVLHYTETSGYDHQTRSVSYAMFEQIGADHGFLVDDDSTGAAFDSHANLQQYDAIIFSNTSGNAILSTLQQQNFEQYMDNGGALIGIHAATDTYRHSTANGNSTGSWDRYAELLGASVQEGPNHVSGTPVYRIDALASHPLLTGVPDPWHKAEEYYYWEQGYFNPSNTVLQQVEQTVGPNGQVNSYDAARPVSWFSVLPSGGRVFYTSLGHAASNYTSDPSFYRLLTNAVLWAGGLTSSPSVDASGSDLTIHPNPAGQQLTVSHKAGNTPQHVRLYDGCGKELGRWTKESDRMEIDLTHFTSGVYLVQLTGEGINVHRKVVKL
jgi:type 1 glutamine amidotransferase